MDKKAFISDADTALANIIWYGIENDSIAKKIIRSQEQISFSSPKNAGTQVSGKLSIFLYNITEETASRNTLTDMSFALRYLVTPFTGNYKDDHILIEKIIQIIIATPVIVKSEENVWLTVRIDSLSLDELGKLWLALGVPLRLSLSLTVSFVEQSEPTAGITSPTVMPQTPTSNAQQVTALYQAVLKTFTEQSTGWKNRSIVISQWLLQDFKKNTGISVEEMLAALNNLGDKLEQHVSTVQFRKPLNLLAGYYQHQLDQLKGMQKVSHKQGENIEIISAWIKDVKDLLKALGS